MDEYARAPGGAEAGHALGTLASNPPDGDTLGLKHIGIALQDLPFPMTRSELLDRAGAWRIPMTGTTFVPLAEFLEGTHRRAYRNADAVLRDVRHAHPELG